MSEKNKTLAMILSILWTGIGLAYLDKKEKGLALFAVGLICSLLGRFVMGIFNYIAFALWIISIYLTYKSLDSVKPKPEMNVRTIRSRYRY